MLAVFEEHIKQHFPFLEHSRVLIAVSGGIDSVVLVHLLDKLQLNFSLAHCNFKLRGKESDKDEQFVKELAATLKKNIITTSFDTEKYAREHKLSIQVVARNLRYDWFYRVLKEQQLDYVLTAHTTNDNLETFLINFVRGSGLGGFTGIPPINKKTVRPLLAFSRKDIELFAEENNISWREDQSNADHTYIRNKIRHEVFPLLKEIDPQLLDNFKKTLIYLNESKEIIDDRMETVRKNVLTFQDNTVHIDLLKLEALKNKKAYLYQMLREYGFSEWNNVVDLLTAQPGKELFSKTHRLIKDRTSLILTTLSTPIRTKECFLIEEAENVLSHPIRLELGQTTQKTVEGSHCILVDKNLLKFPLQVRKWKNGDYLCPSGMQGRKKLSRLFKDKKLSLLDKENIWLLTNADDTIIWVIGMRQDRRFMITATTKTLLKISYSL